MRASLVLTLYGDNEGQQMKLQLCQSCVDWLLARPRHKSLVSIGSAVGAGGEP